jgi:hypothetical protein
MSLLVPETSSDALFQRLSTANSDISTALCGSATQGAISSPQSKSAKCEQRSLLQKLMFQIMNELRGA